MNNFESDPQIYKEAFESNEKKILYSKFKNKIYSLDNESKILLLEGLFTLLNAYFNILLSNRSEPLIISGPTSFKTFLSRLLLNEDKQI